MPLLRHVQLPVTALLLLAGLAARAQDGPSLRVTGYGEVVARRELGLRNPGTIEGGDAVRDLEGARVVHQTSRIEARLCRRFGMMFVAENLGWPGILEVTVVSAHPGLLRPDGRTSTGTRYRSAVAAGKAGYVGFTFDHPWELVPGTWTFSVQSGSPQSGGTVLAEQRFEVVLPPDGDQAAAGDCGAVVS